MLWDIFCTVIDNHGDLGVCWRLAADLASRGEAVRLWVDDATALQWMAPAGAPGVTVCPWTPATAFPPPGDVVVEAFGCDIQAAVAQWPGSARFAWINLEYLSAERFAERSHGLPSPVLAGPGAGRTKWFFYPGFTEATGGLLREPDLAARQAAFQRGAWLAGHGVVPAAGEPVFSLFCYEPAALPQLLDQLAARPGRLLVTPGRATAAVRHALEGQNRPEGPQAVHALLSISYLPALPQTDFDHLQWACDLNFVRGEDSLVRALWAGQAFVWQIYPQEDGAHAAKLEAFLDWLQAPADWRHFHRVWNALAPGPLPPIDLPGWRTAARAARARLLAQTDLATQLHGFALKKR